MKTITVTYTCEDVHEIDERLEQLEGELKGVQYNSCVGLVYKEYSVEETE